MGTYIENGFEISYGKPYPLGATVVGDNAVNFAVVMNTTEACGVILYDKKAKKNIRISFCCSNKIGNVRCMKVSGLKIDDYEYNYYIGDEIITDPYAKVVVGNKKWGDIPVELRGGIYCDDYDWEDDSHPLIPFNDSIFYVLHVRGFTKHKSSLVKHPGTYQGLIEKIDYLKELGITTVEMMPAYNFIELEATKSSEEMKDINSFAAIEPKLNYWGYKESYYFAPKDSFAANTNDSVSSFKDMVKALHKNGIEVIMQFFFPPKIKQGYVFEVLKFWMQEYHIDGFHLMGTNLPLSLLATEPMLANTKIICDRFPIDDIYEYGFYPDYKNLAICNDEYMYDVRKLLKSDEGMVCKVLEYMKNVPAKMGNIHYVSHGNTFTLMDVVSYDRKHNEDNGENNRDGASYNGSWNCGFEGSTSKKSVKNLRIRQIKNAIIFNMLSKSTPLIVSGDEFGNSQKGNNNPYCLDNAITWLNWKDIEKNSEIFEFTKSIIAMRKQFGILHSADSFKLSDYKQTGYPDFSLHSEEAWCVDTDPLSRQFGMMYNGRYEGDDVFIYVAVNMHWTSHNFAVPKINGNMKWEVVVNTFSDTDNCIKNLDKGLVNVRERSIVIMLGKKNAK